MVVAALKFLHIATMLAWCAGLIALPLLLAYYGRARKQARFAEFRLITHYGYIGFVTPAAAVSIAAGTALIFVAQVYDLWLMAKLVLVSGMTLAHAWLGHLILQSGESGGTYPMPQPLIALFLGLPLMSGVLWLVLAKPDLAPLTDLLPAVVLEPQERPL
ncbi:MAG: CopD family protein [Gemmobacter sp.]